MTSPQPHHAPTAMELEIAALRAENARLKAAKPAPLPNGLKISTKGAISVYGMGRFPVTLYASQWQELDSKMAEIKAFIIANAQNLANKDVPKKQA